MTALERSGASDADLANIFVTLMDAWQGLGDEGWSYYYGDSNYGSEILPTAETVFALSLYWEGYSSEQTTIEDMIRRASSWLAGRQQGDGSILDEDGLTVGAVHKTALAYLAIEAAQAKGFAPVGADGQLADAQAYILAQQQSGDLSNGGGSWSSNVYDTALALRVLPNGLSDTDGDGIPDGAEALLGTQWNVADAETLLPSNGIANDPYAQPILGEVLLGEPFSATVSVQGGKGPYGRALAGGAFPPGPSRSTP